MLSLCGQTVHCLEYKRTSSQVQHRHAAVFAGYFFLRLPASGKILISVTHRVSFLIYFTFIYTVSSTEAQCLLYKTDLFQTHILKLQQ